MRITSDLALRTRRGLLAAGGAALVGCATLGAITLNIAHAQSTPAAPETFSSSAPGNPGNMVYLAADSAEIKQQQDKFVTTLASKLGVTSDKLQQALKDTQQEVGPMPPLFGPGVKGMAGTAISITSDLSSAAKVIGIREDQLRKELDGKSLTDVARAHSIDPQKVTIALKAARTTDLDQAVQSGKLPADVASKMKSNLDKEMEIMMTMVRATDGAFGDVSLQTVRISTDTPGT
jgi:hypothetical protein